MTAESKDLVLLRAITGRGLTILLWAHVALAVAIAAARGTDWMLPATMMAVLAAAATLSWRISGNGLSTRLTVAVAIMGQVGVLAFQAAGHPWQVDLHMYFFTMLACLLGYCDFRPILMGVVAVALHHLVLNFALPAAIFPGGGDLNRVVLHAVMLLMEGGVLIWLASKLAGLFETAAQKTAEAEAANQAQQQASADRIEADRRSGARLRAAPGVRGRPHLRGAGVHGAHRARRCGPLPRQAPHAHVVASHSACARAARADHQRPQPGGGHPWPGQAPAASAAGRRRGVVDRVRCAASGPHGDPLPPGSA